MGINGIAYQFMYSLLTVKLAMQSYDLHVCISPYISMIHCFHIHAVTDSLCVSND